MFPTTRHTLGPFRNMLMALVEELAWINNALLMGALHYFGALRPNKFRPAHPVGLRDLILSPVLQLHHHSNMPWSADMCADWRPCDIHKLIAHLVVKPVGFNMPIICWRASLIGYSQRDNTTFWLIVCLFCPKAAQNLCTVTYSFQMYFLPSALCLWGDAVLP